MPAVHCDIFSRNFTSTPDTINDDVFKFCKTINPSQVPIYVPVQQDISSVQSECFNNVVKKVEKEGGYLLYGWLIWEWPKVLIEAEHHAVWAHDGTITDITPLVNGETRILFLPDPDRKYDFVTNKRLINIKTNVSGYASVSRWISAVDRLNRTIEDKSIGNQFTIDRAEYMRMAQDIQHTKASVLIDLAQTRRPNDPCICRSGRKFKKCCGPLIQLYP